MLQRRIATAIRSEAVLSRIVIKDAVQRVDDGVKISPLQRAKTVRRVQLCTMRILNSASTALPAGTLVASIEDQGSPGGRTR